MKNIIVLVGVVLLIFLALDSNAQKMDNKKLDKILNETVDSIKGGNGYWEFSFNELTMLMITDEGHNRMRIVTPITYLEDLDESIYMRCLEANFHTALDVKYAISEDALWTVFIHPLKELSEEQLKDAIKQVYFATLTFGGSYSSTDLVFPSKE